MGIPGLLPFVKKACRKGSIEEFRGKRIAIDVSCLLHGTIRIDPKTGKVIHSSYIKSVRKLIDRLLRLNCHVVLVFDGQPLPAKKEVNEQRKAQRLASRKEAEELMRQGLKAQAVSAFQKSVTITPEIVLNTIKAFKDVDSVDIIVAPYEADAQLTFLINAGLVDAVSSIDSDLIVFGCETIIYNLQADGSCMIYSRANLQQCLFPALRKRFDFTVFRRMCMLAGCDYLQGGLYGIGLEKAQLFFSKTSQTDIRTLLPKVSSYLNMSKVKVDRELVESFIRAEKTFLHQIVFDPVRREQVHLHPRPEESDEITILEGDSTGTAKNLDKLVHYAGKISPKNEALRRALGNVMDGNGDEVVLPSEIPSLSIWNTDFYAHYQQQKKEEPRKRRSKEFLGSLGPASPKKRRLSDDVTTPSPEDSSPDEEQGSVMTQRRSEAVQVRNGVLTKWNSDDWMRLYGGGGGGGGGHSFSRSLNGAGTTPTPITAAMRADDSQFSQSSLGIKVESRPLVVIAAGEECQPMLDENAPPKTEFVEVEQLRGEAKSTKKCSPYFALFEKRSVGTLL